MHVHAHIERNIDIQSPFHKYNEDPATDTILPNRETGTTLNMLKKIDKILFVKNL